MLSFAWNRIIKNHRYTISIILFASLANAFFNMEWPKGDPKSKIAVPVVNVLIYVFIFWKTSAQLRQNTISDNIRNND